MSTQSASRHSLAGPQEPFAKEPPGFIVLDNHGSPKVLLKSLLETSMPLTTVGSSVVESLGLIERH